MTAVHLAAAGRTDPGRERENNEDQFVVARLRKTVEVLATSVDPSRLASGTAVGAEAEAEAHLLVVADGVGGHRGGELASEAAVTSLVGFLGEAVRCFEHTDAGAEDEFLQLLERGVRDTHARIVTELGGARRAPATTLTMATVVWPRAYLVHVGDSRAYLLQRGRLRRLTRDQTMAEYMMDVGAWTAETASRSPAGANLTSALGSSDMTPNIGLVDLGPGDTLLLCTDGLTKHVPDETIARLLEAAATPDAACATLVEAALAGGGSDNITAVVARGG